MDKFSGTVEIPLGTMKEGGRTSRSPACLRRDSGLSNDSIRLGRREIRSNRIMEVEC